MIVYSGDHKALDKTILVDGKDCNRCFLICYQEPVHFGWMALNVHDRGGRLVRKKILIIDFKL